VAIKDLQLPEECVIAAIIARARVILGHHPFEIRRRGAVWSARRADKLRSSSAPRHQWFNNK